MYPYPYLRGGITGMGGTDSFHRLRPHYYDLNDKYYPGHDLILSRSAYRNHMTYRATAQDTFMGLQNRPHYGSLENYQLFWGMDRGYGAPWDAT